MIKGFILYCLVLSVSIAIYSLGVRFFTLLELDNPSIYMVGICVGAIINNLLMFIFFSKEFNIFNPKKEED